MSRGGGRGGGRGGRGGRRGGAPALPWESEETDTRPSELFPPYKVPVAKPQTAREQRMVNSFLLIRHQIHESTLHTARKLAPITLSATSSQKHYGQAQLNAKYAASSGALRTRANVDPFTAVPTYSQRFTRQERTLPDFSSRPYCPEFVPKELHSTFEGTDGERGLTVSKGKRKRITLSKLTAMPTAEDVFGINLNGEAEFDEWAEEQEEELDGQANKKRTLEALARIGMEEEPGEAVEDEELEEGQEEEQDEEYDDEDAGDYNAEEYFDNGDDGEDDGGDDDGGRDEY